MIHIDVRQQIASLIPWMRQRWAVEFGLAISQLRLHSENRLIALFGYVGEGRALQVIDLTRRKFHWSRYEPRGRGFKSCRARHLPKASARAGAFFIAALSCACTPMTAFDQERAAALHLHLTDIKPALTS